MHRHTFDRFRETWPVLLFSVALLGLLAGLLFWWAGQTNYAAIAWAGATIPVLIALAVQIVSSLMKGDVGLDVLAALSMSAALGFGEFMAGSVVALMYAGGQLLESFAQGRARREMSALLGRVPHSARRYRGDQLEDVDIAIVEPGDRLLIRQGEVLPVDGHVASDVALLDLSAITGESLPKRLGYGEAALSGSAAAGGAFDLITTHSAADSTYAGIVRLVEAAQASKAPMVRMADRYAVGFLLFTLVLAGLTWYFTEDPVRLLAVLVVATPCPLILAVPVALISGLSRAAGRGVLIKNGGVLEQLVGIRTVILDKTGTVTGGKAEVTDLIAFAPFSETEILQLAASLDQASSHVVATSLINAARERDLPLTPPLAVEEVAGSGLAGQVNGRDVAVGGEGFVAERTASNGELDRKRIPATAMTVAVGIDGRFAGVIVLEDRIRNEAPQALTALRAAGVDRILLASGDRRVIADTVGKKLGVDAVLADLVPEDKVAAVRQESSRQKVMMVGDGVNDAPALAAADVGVSMGVSGAASSSEAADMVLLVDNLSAIPETLRLARDVRRIATQSVVAGLGLSILAMAAAALGYLPPVQGALIQEAIDMAVILNALRALRA
ncbi:heavy metal translocating P-type ATPase [Rhizobium alvei]|uniref:P-type Zn(2+) transporter n=1 Tax=Rhizobium alvei TaxID=1132659 RepID=A0ABT8YJB1_9HYPH|nr:heavy metal translocating P-type ATPase [Rhizobium alvei]MDO6963369.1 heavy metal translocating P-type ATPase [Rhizobium alvei]